MRFFMNELPPDGWFYTRNGQQTGPVTLSELQELARGGALNPRLDLVWCQGMADWMPGGEVEGLFEKRAVPEAGALPPPSPSALAPATSPAAAGELADVMSRQTDWPGARRRSLYLMTLIFPVVFNLGFAAGAAFLSQQLGPDLMGLATIMAALLPAIVAIYFGVQRLANVGMSRWWYLGNFVPLLNLWVGYRMYVCPAGYAYHKKLDGIGVFLAILYWLAILLGVLAIALVIAVMLGAVGDPEIQQQLQEAIRQAMQQSGR
jgi:uncharacterized membrane protein YhaH (DUF805 family)